MTADQSEGAVGMCLSAQGDPHLIYWAQGSPSADPTLLLCCSGLILLVVFSLVLGLDQNQRFSENYFLVFSVIFRRDVELSFPEKKYLHDY